MTGGCPCGSGLSYAACCEELHDGRARAETAVRLMRSRYAAFALGRTDHVFRTWHPRTRPADVDPLPDVTWTGLVVLEVVDGDAHDEEGVVEFEASYDDPRGHDVLHERSRFVRHRGRWVYLDGDTPQHAP